MGYIVEQRIDRHGNPYDVAVPCRCLEVKKAERQIKASGMDKQFDMYSLRNFDGSREPWATMLNAAKRFLALADKGVLSDWFYIGGQSGAGKTHICAALCKELLLRGYPIRHMLWRDTGRRLKSLANDESYGDEIGQFKQAKVLYIDDLFKGNPTDGDYNLAFELIDHRYTRPELITIISSESYLPDIIDKDAAIGGRINQRAYKFSLAIQRKDDSNFRLRPPNPDNFTTYRREPKKREEIYDV